ncbi:MAG: RNA pseudouridine synthase [Aureispira sp.]|nr:RNA pseudouridine synthase [Aureispira sp.]
MFGELQVIYEDNHLIAVNKPSGWLVQGDATQDMPISELVKLYIKERYNKPGDVWLGTIHRLDRPVSGVLLFARTSKALERMNRLFQDRKVEKTYLAITEERPKELEGELTHFLMKDNERNITTAFTRQKYKNSKLAVLKYELLSSIGDHHLLKVNPKTGRPHQIRVQLAKMGCHIRGDRKYGAERRNKDRRIHLHSYSLSFIHPVKKEPVKIVGHIPRNQIWALFEGAIEDYENGQ